MDIIFIRDLRVDAIIGIYEHERTTRQPVSLDLELATDIRVAARSELIEDALDYHALTLAVEAFVANSEYQLVETLAEAIAKLIQQDFGVSWLKLTLHKPQALNQAADVGVIIERGVRA